MKPLHSFTRGGQLAVHQYRMLKQVTVVTTLLSLLTGGITGGYLFLRGTTAHQRSLYAACLTAEFRVNMSPNHADALTQGVRDSRGHTHRVRSVEFLKNPYVQQHTRALERAFGEALWQSLWSAFLMAVLVMGFFMVRGYRTSRKQLERGGRVASPRTLKRLIMRTKQASDLSLGGLPLLKDKETSHIVVTGTTGSGKTNCFHTLLPQIRKRPNRAIVADLTGDFVSKYYREGRDLLLNPFDARAVSWSPWGECLTETHYDALAAAIIPPSKHADSFWENAGKALLSAALKKLGPEQDIAKLYHILVRVDLTAFSAFFQNTDAAAYTHEQGEKMTLSIRATLANHLQSFRFLQNSEETFSIRQWMADRTTRGSQDQWLFLSARPDQRETLRPLLSGWLDTAINALMSLPPDQNRRLWFILDELPALQKLPSLEIGLAEGRKYGGCFLAGVQSVPQIATTYGHTQSQAILDLFNTKIFFRNTDPHTTAWISKVLGEAETTEYIENLSYGANTTRDGVSLSQQTRMRPLILPSEIGALKDCQAYLKFSGNLPIAKIQMRYQKILSLAVAFQRIAEADFLIEKKREEAQER